MSNIPANVFEEKQTFAFQSAEVVDLKNSLFRSILSTFGSCGKNIDPQQK